MSAKKTSYLEGVLEYARSIAGESALPENPANAAVQSPIKPSVLIPNGKVSSRRLTEEKAGGVVAFTFDPPSITFKITDIIDGVPSGTPRVKQIPVDSWERVARFTSLSANQQQLALELVHIAMPAANENPE